MDYLKNTFKLSFFGYLFIFALYIALRYIAWMNTILLEDHDSVGYLYEIKIFWLFDLHKIINMGPDSTPFYPFFSALCSFPNWSVETAARFCSLLFSSLLFLCIVLIGKQIAKPLEIAIGLIILSLSPVLIPLSYAVLTEPSYIATCYLGLLFFLIQYKKPTLWHGAILGIIFALCFLNRTEGLFYLLVIPFMQTVHFFASKHTQYDAKRLTGWICIFFLFFTLFAAPQIWRVSHKMGHFAINGRQTWTLILKNPDGKSYDEKIYGLDHNSLTTNLSYVQGNPDTNAEYMSNVQVKSFLKIFLKNYSILYQDRLGHMSGPFGIIFFVFGLLALYQANRRSECFVIITFIVSALIAPMLHLVDMRYIAIIAPLIIIVTGLGINYIARSIGERFSRHKIGVQLIVTVICICAVIGSFSVPLYRVLFEKKYYNREYNPRIIKHVASIVKEISIKEGISKPVIISRKAYLYLYGDTELASMPYTDYKTLVKYSTNNNADFLFLQHRLIKKHPFLETFLQPMPPVEFELIYRTLDDYNDKIELYRFNKKKVNDSYMSTP